MFFKLDTSAHLGNNRTIFRKNVQYLINRCYVCFRRNLKGKTYRLGAFDITGPSAIYGNEDKPFEVLNSGESHIEKRLFDWAGSLGNPSVTKGIYI